MEELAEKAGLRIGLVANVENGREFPVREPTLAALESVLGELERPGPTGPLCDKEPLRWRRSNGEWNHALYVERADKGDEVTVPVLGTTHDATRDGRIIDSSGDPAPLDIRLEPKPPRPARHDQPARPGVVLAVEADTNKGKSHATHSYVHVGILNKSIKASVQFSVRITHSGDLKRTADRYYGDCVNVACYNQKKGDESTTQHLKYEKHIIISPETASFDVLGNNIERFDGGVLILDEVHSLA